ncbi:putative transporter mch1 [Daldinia childiae]|uniref:putative transporter mch1 n=1 Tax=Daldinia childiae TaxID=326645 RepID=UPI001447D23E|nr:putative transporter mch1 [Daldinia childiae]KAF3070338.1 putative transporter mch1 [Daldinia childiae]
MATPSTSTLDQSPLLRSRSSSTLGSLSSNTSISDASRNLKLRQKTRVLRAVAFVVSIITALCAGSITVFSLYGHLFQSRLHYTQFQINGIASAMSLSMYLPVPVIGFLCDRVGPAFVAIGIGTSCMYLGAITTCAKNFGQGKYRGLMLVAPIASFGLGGMVLSQIGSRILYETQPDGARDINVFHFFLFLCVVLAVLGLIGTFSLRVVDEEDLIDGAVEELERSGLLEGSEVFRRRAHRDYGAIDAIDDDAGAMDPARDEDDEDDNARLKKAWLLNAETRSFLSDHTMWWFGIGFWLIIGPGEAFINNLGTVVGTLYSPSTRSNETVAERSAIAKSP